MRTPLLAASAAAVLTFGMGVGAAFASGASHPNGPISATVGTSRPDLTTMDRMHAQMHERMPVDSRQQCDALHAQMRDHMGSMSSGSMSSGAMGSDHVAHHGGTTR